VTLGALGVVGHAIGHAATMRDALPFYGRCAGLVSDLFMPRIHERDGRAVFEQVSPPELVWLRHPGEMCLAAALTLSRGLTGIEWPVLAVRFQHAAPPSRQGVDAFFGRRASFGAPSNRLELDVAALSAPIRGADPQVFEYLGHHADALVSALPRSSSVAEEVRRSIGPTLANGEPPQDRIARRLGMSGRTLQRRLREEGTTFAGVLDAARRERAMIFVAEARLSSAEIAFLLGYAEPTAFFRAFRRWTGTTPRAYREARSPARSAPAAR
jgi:AraC-like DNA-binding protein